jgi:hypothetical protein
MMEFPRREHEGGVERYVIRDGEPVLEPDFLIWARENWGSNDRVLAETIIIPDEVRVSTIFTGVNTDYQKTGPPMLWETMIFGGPLSMEQVRYRSPEAALAGHEAMVLRAKDAEKTVDRILTR